MIWSWWKVLILPLRAARTIASLREECDRWEERASKAETNVESLKVTVMTHRETALIQARQLRQLQEKLEERENELAKIRSKMEVVEEDLDQYNRLVELINTFEAEKLKYEERIKTLRIQLKDARRALKQSIPLDLEDLPRPLDLLDNTPATSFPKPSLPHPEDTHAQSPADDWLQELPDNIQL